ncbi:MAG: hypothetical protein AMXMBFR58_22340 [Phycisphaerae bacterium]
MSPPLPATIMLMGLRGSGKSTLGRQLAQRLDRPFVDLDDVTPSLLNRTSVAEAWANDGPEAFRQAEFRALQQQLSPPGRVIALGGGTPTAPGASQWLDHHRKLGDIRLIYLAANADQLRERLRAALGPNRPSLTGGDPLAEIDRVLADRDALYRRLASHVIDAGAMSESQALDALLAIAADAQPGSPGSMQSRTP